MSTFLHSSAWENFQKKYGRTVARHDRQLYIKYPFKFGHYWFSPRCQLKNNLQLAPFAQAACFARFEPEDENSYQRLLDLATTEKWKLLPTLAVHPRQTSILNLQKSSEDLLAGFKPKQRYNLRLAQKADLKVDIYSHNLSSQFNRFWDLLEETATRQGFRTHPAEYYRLMLSELELEKMAHLLFVTKDQTDLAAMILITYQETATYLHGASRDSRRELMAPYLLHWEGMNLAKKSGCSHYDFWGVDARFNPQTNAWQEKEGHLSAGTTRFKLGFGGEITQYPGCFDLILKPFCYTLYKSLRALRRNKRAFS